MLIQKASKLQVEQNLIEQDQKYDKKLLKYQSHINSLEQQLQLFHTKFNEFQTLIKSSIYE